MTVRLSCRAGHEWETVENAGALSTVCPICGEAVTAADDSLVDHSTSDTLAAEVDDLPPLPEIISNAETAHLAPSTKIANDFVGPTVPGYQFLRELGRGGMGIVYLASQTNLNRLVAIKLLRAGVDADESELDRFRAEAEAVASLQHPNVVQVFEVGTHGGRSYFTQEFLGGGDLAARINGTPWPPRRAAELVRILATAVHYAHERGIVHRDLKPANILFASRPRADDDIASGKTAAGEAIQTEITLAKITDFGIAKRLDARSDRTATGVVVGTPSYMAPEQAAGMSRDVGPRADVYALGAILYELLTGRPPFKAATATETLHQVLNDDPIAPTRLVSRVPRDVETICLKCLAKAPTRRYATARALAEDLRRFDSNEPILARPVTALERFRKWTRRRPAAAALIGVLIAGAIAATTFGLRYQQDVTQERNRYLAERNRFLEQRDAAVEARTLSDRHFQRALAAVDQMLKRLGLERLEPVPHMDETRRALLEDALNFYLEFLEDEGEDLKLRAQASQIAERTGAILFLMGRFDEAEAMERKALRWQKELAKMHPDQPILPRLIGLTHNSLGMTLYRTGRLDEARKELTLGLEHRQRLAQADPDNAESRFDVAASQVNLALVERDAGQNDLVESYLNEAVAAGESLVQAFPQDERYSLVLGRARNDLGVLYLSIDRAQDAVIQFEKNTKHWQQLVETMPGDPFLRGDLARNLANLAQASLSSAAAKNQGRVTFDDLAGTKQLHLQALAIREQLEGEHPQILAYAIDTGYSYMWLGRLSYLEGDYPASCQWCAKSVAKLRTVQQRSPKEPKLLGALYDAHYYGFASAEKSAAFDEGLAHVEALISLDEKTPLGPPNQLERLRAMRVLYLARLGRHRDAHESFRAIPEESRTAWDGDVHYGLACAWSHCGSAAEQDASLNSTDRNMLIADYVSLSLQMLEKARMGGRLSTDAQKQHLATDPELSWLRGRAEFQPFAESLAANSPGP